MSAPLGATRVENNAETLDATRVKEIAEKRGVTPCQALFAVFLASLADAEILNQATVNYLAKTAAPRLHAYLRSMGLLDSSGATTRERIENLVRSLNRALEIGPEPVVEEKEPGLYEVGLGGDGCRYCPRGVGLAQIPWPACPFPRILEGILRREGIRVTALPRDTEKGRSYVVKRGSLCWILLRVET